MIHVGMVVAKPVCLAKAYSVNDAGMVQPIADHSVLFCQQGFKQPAVGIEARGIEDGVFGLQELGNLLLQLFVDFLSSTNESHRSHAVTILFQSVAGRVENFRVVGQTQIIVGAKI